MKVAKNTVVSIAYQVRTQDGVLVDEAPANQPLEYLQGHNNLIIGLENALEGKEVGDKFEVRVQPEEGYGEYNENMVQRVPKDVFQGVDEVVVGMRFLADTDIGPVPVVITEVDGDEVVVDGNHMLAGQELHFTVEVVGTREATLEEIAHGHVHGEHDHHHHHDDECGCGCGHDHDHEEHEHHHHHDGECDDPECSCHHHHHHADEVFTSWGAETVHSYTEEDIRRILTALDTGDYGAILRAKGIVPSGGKWLHFDYVPEEQDVRYGSADYTGRLCVIGAQLKEDKLKELFSL